MLERLSLHKEEVGKVMETAVVDDLRYKYYYGSWHQANPYLSDSYRAHQDDSATWQYYEYACLDEGGNVVGQFPFGIEETTRSIYAMTLMSFDLSKPNMVLIDDALRKLHEVFYTRNLNKMAFQCYPDNPAFLGYMKFMEKVGGRVCGHCRDDVRLSDLKLHDVVKLEVLEDEFRPIRRYIEPGWENASAVTDLDVRASRERTMKLIKEFNGRRDASNE